MQLSIAGMALNDLEGRQLVTLLQRGEPAQDERLNPPQNLLLPAQKVESYDKPAKLVSFSCLTRVIGTVGGRSFTAPPPPGPASAPPPSIGPRAFFC
jgi:hypothetical protein